MTALSLSNAQCCGCPHPPNPRMVARSRVLVVDDHPIVVLGVRRLLSVAHDFEVVGQASTGRQAIETAISTDPDLILLDLRLPDDQPAGVCRRLRGIVPRAQLVVFTAFIDEALLRDCLASGVVGVLLKDAHELDLVGDLRRIRSGLVVIDGRVPVAATAADELLAKNCMLSLREHQILRLIAEGLSSKEIAGDLGLSPRTVDSHCESLLRKLQAKSRIRAVAHARACGLL
jgi:DNA-binding NarL/FixJ family response regulator